jgi:hypothetical protein
MRWILRTMALAGILALGGPWGLGTSSARAQGFGYGGYSGGGYYGGGYGGLGYSPTYQYYGNGGHDAVPHWHNTYTPFGTVTWFGSGAHDFQPHEHTVSPYGGYRGYSAGPFGITESIYQSTPYIYMPW